MRRVAVFPPRRIAAGAAPVSLGNHRWCSTSNTPTGKSSGDKPSGGPAQPQTGDHHPGDAVPPQMDAKAAEQMKIAQELGQEAFEENTAILKQVATRGLRAFVICAVGLAASSWAMKRKRRQLAADSGTAGASADEDEDVDPTQRYLEEMRGLGFDVDTLEEELEQERKQKSEAAAKKVKRSIS